MLSAAQDILNKDEDEHDGLMETVTRNQTVSPDSDECIVSGRVLLLKVWPLKYDGWLQDKK